MEKAFWKPYAASAIAFGRRFRDDPFFRTEVTIVLLQAAFALFIIALVIAAFTILYREVLTSLISDILAHLRANQPFTSPNDLTAELEYLKSRDLIIVGAIILGGTAIFSYLMARLAFAPTRDALESQKRFIANVAHELRTPLSIIRTNTEVRLLDPDVPATAREIHESNLEELNRISEIINNLLSLSSFTRTRALEFSNVDLGIVVEKMVKELQGLATRKQLSVKIELGEPRIVWGNASALEQIVRNLLKNAIAYTRKGGEPVTVAVRPDLYGAVELTVEDSGIGIPEKDLRRIFEPFYRGDRSRRRGESGSGLGLSIVSELMKIHHGRLTIRSATNRGTKVTISLPGGKNRSLAGPPSAVYDEVAIDFSR